MTVSNYDSEAVGWSRAIRQRRNALTQRLFLGCTAALVFSPIVGWTFGMIWTLAYVAVQVAEIAVFSPVNRGQPEAMGWLRTQLGHLTLFLNAFVFGALSIPLWLEGGAMGGICGTMLLCAGAIYSTINSPGSTRVLATTLAANFCYLALTPWMMHAFGADPAYTAAAAIATVTFIIYCLSTWRRMTTARTAEENARVIAEARQLEAERAMASRAAFLAAVGHELRTPISAIMTGASELERTAGGIADRQRAGLIIEAGEMMKAMLDDLLDNAKLDAGRMTVNAEPFDLRQLVVHTHHFWKGAISAKGLRLRIEGAARVPRWVEGDPVRLRQILNNLISNALKFTHDGTVTVRIRAWDQDGAVALTLDIIDTGPGMDADQLARLFTPFDQIDGGITARHGGTGLGLSISRDLAQLMGGWLTARSGRNEGATFTLALTLPRASAPDAPVIEAPEAVDRVAKSRPLAVRKKAVEPTPEATPMIDETIDTPISAESDPVDDREAAERPLRVLVVDDHEINRRAVQLILTPLGVEIGSAADGIAALALTEVQTYDVIFMDVRMPELDGRETTRRLRAGDGPNRTTPVIAVTADTAQDDIDACMAAGMDYFVSKPLTPAALLGALNHVLAEAQAARETEAA